LDRFGQSIVYKAAASVFENHSPWEMSDQSEHRLVSAARLRQLDSTTGQLPSEFALEHIYHSMEGLCLKMRLVKLQHLISLPRNHRYAILLGDAEEGRYKVAIPGDSTIFSLKPNNIDILSHLKGYTMSKNIITLKRHQIDILNAWKNIYVDPGSVYSMGASLGIREGKIGVARHKIPDRLLIGVTTSPDTIEFGFINLEEMIKMCQFSYQEQLLQCWNNNDMPYKNSDPSSETVLGSCNQFYAARSAKMLTEVNIDQECAALLLQALQNKEQSTQKHKRMETQKQASEKEVYERRESERRERYIYGSYICICIYTYTYIYFGTYMCL